MLLKHEKSAIMNLGSDRLPLYLFKLINVSSDVREPDRVGVF